MVLVTIAFKFHKLQELLNHFKERKKSKSHYLEYSIFVRAYNKTKMYGSEENIFFINA